MDENHEAGMLLLLFLGQIRDGQYAVNFRYSTDLSATLWGGGGPEGKRKILGIKTRGHSHMEVTGMCRQEVGVFR